MPFVGFVLIAPILWVFFGAWRELDVEAHEHQRRTLAAGGWNSAPPLRSPSRPPRAYDPRSITEGASSTTSRSSRGLRCRRRCTSSIRNVEAGSASSSTSSGTTELYGYGWWSFTRVFGYVVVPFAVWKIVFRRDSILDMGLRTRGLIKHAWIYLLCLAVVLPAT